MKKHCRNSYLSRKIATLLCSVTLLGIAACSRAPSDSPAETTQTDIEVVATTGMIADLARNIAGEYTNVTGLIGAGIDPHLYKPTRSDIQRLMNADIVFYNGLLLEGKMTDALIRAATSGKPVHAVTELLDEQYLLSADDSDHYDPHVWMDPSAWLQAIAVILDRLIEHDPDNAEVYRTNAAEYSSKVSELDSYAETILGTVPESSRVLITAHDAFGYFGRRFDYRVIGIQGISTESEAGVRDIERLVDILVEQQIRAVFVESTVSDRNIQAMIDGARARGHTVAIGGSLFSDAMGAPGTYEGTYIGMIDHNVTTIALALGGEASERGMNGSLAE